MLDIQRPEAPIWTSDSGVPPQPSSPTTNREDNAQLLKFRKRRLVDVDEGLQLQEPFFVQAHSSLPSSESQQLIPSLLLLRSCLPLAYLEPITKAADHSGPRFFSANIEVLERDVSNDLSFQPIVLIAQSTGSHHLWAVERVQSGIYALCRLNKTVTLKALQRLQAIPCQTNLIPKSQHPIQAQESDREWWRSAVIRSYPGVRDSVRNCEDNRRIGGLGLCLQRPIQNTPSQNPRPRQTSHAALSEIEVNMGTLVNEVSQGPEEILSTIRSQYQEALYASQTPLAYFAKGPLSRARATFNPHDASGFDLSVLVHFLRSSILTLATMDTKYRETLPSLIKDLPFATFSGDEGASIVAAIGKRPRKYKKSKVGKNGLYAGEEVSIVRWWLGTDKSSIASESADLREDAIKTILLEQRVRETQLQVILILEILALEANATDSPAHHAPLGAPLEEGEDPQRKPKKPKRPQDLDTLLDLLVDRLCIWQSMSTLETKRTNAIDTPSSEDGPKSQSRIARNDHLRQFCVDVVLPFYGARLTELTTMLCQKLGGPKEPSPKRPTPAKAATSHVLQQPGAPLQREKARRPRRTLERVLTDERSASQRPPPSLSRSVTEPTLPQMKREKSDTSLSAIPLNRVAMHKRYSQREVDFNAASQATEAKLKQKARVGRELQSAIAAMKKPNPRMAVKELVEDAERRVAGSRSRKSKNPVRNPFAQGLQIMATPSKHRHNNVFASLPPYPKAYLTSAVLNEVDEVPPSSISRITDSTRRERGSTDRALDKRRHDIGSVVSTIEQTPTRGPSKLLGRVQSSISISTADDDHSAPRRDTMKPKSPKNSSAVSFLQPPAPYSSSIQFTPSKARTLPNTDEFGENVIRATPNKTIQYKRSCEEGLGTAAALSSEAQETSIYADLGWDDDLDDLS